MVRESFLLSAHIHRHIGRLISYMYSMTYLAAYYLSYSVRAKEMTTNRPTEIE